jgi:two-component system, OmpR family, response regulator CpxR
MNRCKLLVVEDDIDIRESMIEVLEENGCEVVGAADGLQALVYLKRTDRQPCLILLDLMMPVMDGEAFREAQLNDPVLSSIPVVVVSAYGDVQARAKKLQVESFIKKPVKIDELMTAVERLC